MAETKELKARLVQKHDTEANWAQAVNFIPKQGEIIIYDIDSSHSAPRLKIGDGVSIVTDLPFITSVTTSTTLSSSAWSSGVYTYSNTNITATSIIELIPATSITAEQLIAFQNANVVGTAQAAGSVTITAFGTVPSIDIPVVFVIRG